MEKQEMIEKLEDTAHLDIDALGVYDRILEHVDDDQVLGNLRMFRDDHERHAEWLADKIRELGGEQPERKPDLMGRLAEWGVSLRSVTGQEGALAALHRVEQYHVNRYSEAAGWQLGDADIERTLQSFYDDEKRHEAYASEKATARQR